MSGNIGSNGRIKINAGEGLSQAILREAGVSSQDAGKIKGSVWNEIFKQVIQQQQKAVNGEEGYEKLYSGGSNLRGSGRSNFVIKKGAVLQFAQDTWNNILNIINKALGKTDANKFVYDAENTKNDGGTTPPATQTRQQVAPTPVALTQGERITNAMAEDLMGKAMANGAKVEKKELKDDNNKVIGYSYEYVETNSAGTPERTVYVNTDLNGKATKVVFMSPSSSGGVTTTEYDLENNTMQTGNGDVKQLKDTDLKSIKEKAFLMSNQAQISAAQQAVTDIVAEFNNPASTNTITLCLAGKQQPQFILKDGRSVVCAIDENNQIIKIFITETNNNQDHYSNVDFASEGYVEVDVDGLYDTNENNQNIILSDTQIFQDLKAQLQPLVDANKNKIAELRTDDDSKFKADNQEYFTRADNTLTALIEGARKNTHPMKGLISAEYNKNGNKEIVYEIEGKKLCVEIKNNSDGTRSIVGISIKNDTSLSGYADFSCWDTGNFFIDKDMNTENTKDDQIRHRFSDLTEFNNIKAKVLKFLEIAGTPEMSNLS